jgi:hypothetical protein
MRSGPSAGLCGASQSCYDVGMKRTHLFLPEQTLKALRDRAHETGLSVAELIRRAVDAMLRRK